MKILISTEKLESCSSADLVPLECQECLKTFELTAVKVRGLLSGTLRGTGEFCSKKCSSISKKPKSIKTSCAECNNEVIRKPSQQNKGAHSFCNLSCAAKYNNKHKKTGFRRSRAEDFLSEKIKIDFPELEIQTNVRGILKSGLEIDIFLPEVSLAIELNGPVHYFPIYGQDKLESIQDNDLRKQAEIVLSGCNLIVINISQYKYWKNTNKFLDNYYNSHVKGIIENHPLRIVKDSNL